MGFITLLIICAVLQISLCAGVNSSSEDLSNIHNIDSSNHHDRHARGNDEDFLDYNINLEFREATDPPEDAALVPVGEEQHYIFLSGKCKEVKLEHKKSDAFSQGNNKESRKFLVNKNNFELLEWKTLEKIHQDRTPVSVMVICKRFYIARKNNALSLVAIKKSQQTELLTINYDIKSQRLHIDNYDIKDEKKSEMLVVLKQFIVKNRNCEPAKHVVKLDQGRDKSQTFQKGRTHTFGGAIEGSVSGKIASLVNVNGKIIMKYDQSRLNSETKSDLDMVLHSVSMEINVPPNHSCSVEISSRTIMVEVPYSAQLTREYQNGEIRTTSITGILDHQEVAELLTSVDPCKPLPDKTECGKL